MKEPARRQTLVSVVPSALRPARRNGDAGNGDGRRADGFRRRAGAAAMGGAALAGRAARRHWMLTVLLAAGLALRVVTQAGYRPALVYIDSYKYLIGAGGYDPVGYRVLLKPVLWVGNLATVAAVQHALGLAMAITLYTLLTRRGTPRWTAALATAPLLLDAYQLQLEQTIMPDVMFETLILTGLTLLLWNPRPTPWMITGGALLLGATADIRQIGEVLIVPVVVFALVMGRGWRRLLHPALAAVCFALPILGYMSVSAATGGGFSLTTRGTDVLYGRAAAAANCATLRLPAGERSLCPSPEFVAMGIDQIINNPGGPYETYKPAPGQTVTGATNDFDLAVLRQQPLAIPLSIARDAVRLFALTKDGAANITPISRWQFQPGYAYYPPGVTYKSVAADGQAYGGGAPVAVQPLATFLRAYQLDGGYTPGPLLAAMTLAGMAGSVIIFSRRAGSVDRRLAAAALLATLAGAAVLVGSDIYEFSWRYQLPALVTLPLAGALGYTVIARRLREGRTIRRERRYQGRLAAAGPAEAPAAETLPDTAAL